MTRAIGILLVLPLVGLLGLRLAKTDGEVPAGLAVGSTLPGPAAGSPSLVENCGQWAERVHFAGGLSGMGVFLELGGIDLELRDPDSGSEARLHWIFEGASLESVPVGLDPRAGIYNYFIENDPRKWHRDVRRFARVKYADLYPGIDLIVGSTDEGLKYDLVLAPGADLGRVALRCAARGRQASSSMRKARSRSGRRWGRCSTFRGEARKRCRPERRARCAASGSCAGATRWPSRSRNGIRVCPW